MVSEDQIITVNVSPAELAFLRTHAQRAEIGGKSNIRDSDERRQKMRQDQLIGQIGCFVGIKTLFGDPFIYRVSRFYADIYRDQGDGGSDVPGGNIDFKASMIANKQKPLLSYKLAVRSRERHAGTVYILILIALEPAPVANLVGWASDEMLPAKPETEGPFAGAYVIPASALHPIMPLRWFDEARPPTTKQTGLLKVDAIDIKW